MYMWPHMYECVPPHVYTCKLNFFLKKELRTEKDFGNLSSVCYHGYSNNIKNKKIFKIEMIVQ